ncbi:uncharacterized protein ACOB6Z_016704 [Ctenodactylus gundi]
MAEGGAPRAGGRAGRGGGCPRTRPGPNPGSRGAGAHGAAPGRPRVRRVASAALTPRPPPAGPRPRPVIPRGPARSRETGAPPRPAWPLRGLGRHPSPSRPRRLRALERGEPSVRSECPFHLREPSERRSAKGRGAPAASSACSPTQSRREHTVTTPVSPLACGPRGWHTSLGSPDLQCLLRAQMQQAEKYRVLTLPVTCLEDAESSVLDDIICTIQNKAIERVISPMAIQLCHLLISMERKDVKSEIFASLEKTAEELASASEEFVQVAKRLAGESEEEWLGEEMEPVAASLSLSGRNIKLVAQKLHLQPERRCHREELVTTAQQILVDTAKVLLLEDALMARKMARAVAWCLTCLDALEAAEDATSLRGPFTELAEALALLGRLAACRPGERLGGSGSELRGCILELLAAARGHLRRPRDPRLAASRRHAFALARKSLRELLGALERGAPTPDAGARNGAFTRSLRQLRETRLAPAPEAPRRGLPDAPLAAVVWHCVRLAAVSVPPERRRLVASCRRLLELGRSDARACRPAGPREERAALRAATEALSQGVRAGLLRQILDAFTDPCSPLGGLLHAALGTPAASAPRGGAGLRRNLQLSLSAFRDQARQMLRVARLVLVCCPRQQTGRDVEASMAELRELVLRVEQLFSRSPQGSGLGCSPVALQALLQAWACTSERMLACFDDVLDIPEFLSVSIQEMVKHLDSLTWTLRSGDPREFSKPVAYLWGRATHIVQVMSRYVGQHRDPIFRNGLRVFIWQLEQSASALAVAAGPADHRSGGYRFQDTDAFLTMAKHLIYSAQQVQEGLDGTNHPDILSPLRDQVHRVGIAKSSLQYSTPPGLEHLRMPRSGESKPGASCPPTKHLSYPLIPGSCAQKKDASLPAANKVVLTVERREHQTVTSACTSMLEQDAAVDAAQEAPAGEGPQGSERMPRFQEISMLAPSVSDLAKEMAHSTTARHDKLLEVALQLSGKTRETTQGLVALAGDWYLLCQQLFCHNPTTDLPGSVAVFVELQQNLASMVQLAAKLNGPTDLDRKVSGVIGWPEALLQVQGRLEEAEMHARELLEKVLAAADLQWEESIENGCLLWSVAVQDLVQSMERLSRTQSLFLLPLRQAVKDQQRLQEGLDQIADVSQRLQEAARLSGPLCGDEQVKGEVSFLCREVHVLSHAVLDVAQILASSPRPSPSLSTRFDLLCLELTLRAKALTGHLSSINADYECAFHDAVCLRLAGSKNLQTRTESSLERMVSNIQAVQGIVARGQETGPCQRDLLVALECILTVTKEVAQRVPVLQEHPEEWKLHMLDWLRWEWAAKAHHAVAQLRAWKGDHTKAWRLLTQCLGHREESRRAPQHDSVQPQLHCDAGTTGTFAVGSEDSQHADPRGSPESSVGICAPEPAATGTTTADMGTQQSCPARLHAEMDQPLLENVGADNENRITQITQEIAREVFLMAQSLRKREHALTKDQLITSARKIAASGQNFTRLICIIAKNCTDQRCSQELLCAVEQIQTMSKQLHILSSVKASLARSKSSTELLVDNAKQLLQAVSRTLRSAEAASLRGLRPPSSDPEELEVAAFCTQWRRKLLRYRLQETPNVDYDEFGLRKTSPKRLPTLAGLAQEAL